MTPVASASFNARRDWFNLGRGSTVPGHTHRLKLLSGLGLAACLMLTTIAPTYAQSASGQSGSQAGSAAGALPTAPAAAAPAPAPVLTNWSSGPGAVGNSTYIGRVETPRIGQIVNTGNGLLVSGWVADVTAQGWAGIDGVELWSGDRTSGGTKLGTGTVGLPRPDIGDIVGSNFTNSGFSMVVPSSAWANIPAGNVELRLYVHTPNKGYWYRATHVTSVQPPTLPYPNDPVVYIAKPQNGMNITQRQLNNKITFSGVALDRNPLSAVQNSLSILPAGIGQSLSGGCSACLGSTGYIYTQFRGAGVDTITAYIDSPPKPGDNSTFGLFGSACAACTQGVSILNSGKGVLNVSGKPQGSVISDSYGLQVSGDPQQFRYGGWVISIEPALLSPGPHTLFVSAHSTVTGKTQATSSAFNIIGFTNSSQRIQP